MQTMNESMRVSREMKVLFLQMLKQGEITKDDAEALKEILTAGGYLVKPTRIVFKKFNETEKDNDSNE